MTTVDVAVDVDVGTQLRNTEAFDQRADNQELLDARCY